MAEVRWMPRAKSELRERLTYARMEFGETTANRWADSIKRIEHQLSIMPESFTPEPLLRGSIPIFRFCPVMKRFKLIYFYQSASDTVFISDIWDSRMNPEALKQRLT